MKDKNSMIKIFILCLTTLWLFSCADNTNYGGNPPNNPPAKSVGPDPGFGGFRGQPGNQNTVVPTPPSTTTVTTCPARGQWGGVTCNSGTNRDRSFLDFLSDKSNNKGVGNISCQPSNNGGVLVRMKVTLNAPFNPNGNNNNLAMQIDSSHLEIHIHDSKVNSGVPAFQIPFEGLSGEVNGNKATLNFIYNKNNVRKTVTFQGTFNADIFTGEMSFENSVHVSGGTPTRGSFGSFKIATCSVFTPL